MNNISPLAYVDPAAQIGDGNEIGPFCYIDKNVVLGDNNVLMPSVTLLSGARIGSGNRFFPGAVIAAIPQDLKFKGEETTAEIGDNNKIRENVTINRGTAGNGCIIGNSTKLAGEVVVDDNAILSANVLIHQFCRVGGYVMIGGGSRTSQDIPPFIIAAREPIAYCGLNIVGLRRRQFSADAINAIHEAYRIIYQSGKMRDEAIAEIRETVPMTKEVEYIIDFVASSKRGILR